MFQIHPFLKVASAKSVWRGLGYHQEGRVLSCVQDGQWFVGDVRGSEGETYQVRIDIDHPRKSTCTCPHAKERLVVCKHKVALFFEADPIQEERFLYAVEQEQLAYEQAQRERWDSIKEDIKLYVKSLTKAQLQEELIEALIELEMKKGDDWRY